MALNGCPLRFLNGWLQRFLWREDTTHETTWKLAPPQNGGGLTSKTASSQDSRKISITRLFGAWFSGSVCFSLGGPSEGRHSQGWTSYHSGPGRLTALGESEDTIREPLQQLINGGSNRVAFNLINVTDLDSSGIGVLMRSFISVSRAGGKSTFFSANHRVRMVLKMVRLDTVLDLVPDEATALSRL